MGGYSRARKEVAFPLSPVFSVPSRESKGARDNAGARYCWHPVLGVFAWERGEGLDSKPKRGTVKSSAAVHGAPLTLRLSLVGGPEEGQNTTLSSDWQRGYTISAGNLTKSVRSLAESSAPPCSRAQASKSLGSDLGSSASLLLG